MNGTIMVKWIIAMGIVIAFQSVPMLPIAFAQQTSVSPPTTRKDIPITISDNENACLELIAPDELKRVRERLSKPLDRNLANDILAMIEAVKRKLTSLPAVSVKNTAAEVEMQKKTDDAFRASWGIAIEFLKRSDDRTVNDILQREWDIGLSGKFATIQIAALAEHWDSELFSPSLVVLFQNDDSEGMLRSMGYIVAHYGTDVQVSMIKQRMMSLNDANKKEILQNAINWHTYWSSGNNKAPGPAAAPPTPW